MTTQHTQVHQGSCLCGRVMFQISGPFEHFFLCHCPRCRKGSGSAHAANLFSTRASLDWLSGNEQVRSFRVDGTRHERCFCTICGSALPMFQAGGSLLMVPAGSLDGPVTIRPAAHIFSGSRADWDHDLYALPWLDGSP